MRSIQIPLNPGVTAPKQVPVLKDIPLIGGLFRSASRNKEQRELVVFLTPHIVETDEPIMNDRMWQLKQDVEDLVEENRGVLMK